ncbi:restriction endonuclease [Candidatus Margulisiibacteriota bacterium]
MRIFVNKDELITYIVEYTALDTGILISEPDLINYFSEEEFDYNNIFKNDLITLRGEVLEEILVYIEHRLGYLKNTQSGQNILFQGLQDLAKTGVKPEEIEKIVKLIPFLDKYQNLEEIIITNQIDPKLAARILDLFSKALKHSWNMFKNPKSNLHNWDGVTPLNDLFETEITPSNPSQYFDQKFLDFLAVNSESLTRMHWRNFERLISEFFNQKGYYVDLGPGTKDGGIDIRIWNDKKSTLGPPLILVQCKRYKKKNLVALETIKAFYADTIHEQANIGLIATTSRITPAGTKIIKTRGYPLKTIEQKDIVDYLYSNWRKRKN